MSKSQNKIEPKYLAFLIIGVVILEIFLVEFTHIDGGIFVFIFGLISYKLLFKKLPPYFKKEGNKPPLTQSAVSSTPTTSYFDIYGLLTQAFYQAKTNPDFIEKFVINEPRIKKRVLEAVNDIKRIKKINKKDEKSIDLRAKNTQGGESWYMIQLQDVDGTKKISNVQKYR